MKKVAFYTLGCKVNQYETEAVTEIFEKVGYKEVSFEEIADVYVINTCTVTSLSDRKSRQMIRRAKKNNIDSIVIVMGCYSQTAPEEVGNIPGVNLVLGTKNRLRIIEYIKEIELGDKSLMNVVGNIMTTKHFEELTVKSYKERTRAFLKIQDGCSQFCSYCIIPYARGPIRSRPAEEILTEVRALAASGFKEVVLTGIHVASYGKDFISNSEHLNEGLLLEIIKKVHDIEGIDRIRLGSLEPASITEDFVKEVKNLSKLCPHYHISLQSGCDATLKRMNRKYTTAEYEKVVNLMRDNIEDVNITTDIMVGFPGEIESEFLQTLKYLKRIELSSMHVFKYSPRKGTPAASFEDQILPKEKEKRSNILLSLSIENANKFNHSFVGRTFPVLFEKKMKTKEGCFEGLTANYIRVVSSTKEDIEGNVLNVKMERACEDFIEGSIEK